MLYRQFLRLPGFRGKARIDSLLKRLFFTHRASAVFGGLQMWLDPMESAQGMLLCDGVIEPLTINLFRRILKHGDVYVDVGAHVGFHTLIARTCVGERGQIIAFEPQPYNCERILENWRLNNFTNLDLFVAAAGDRGEMLALHAQGPTDKSRLSLALPEVNNLPQQFRVPMLPLDQALADVGRIALVKIDAEGFEPEILRGMTATLDRVDNLIIEALPGAEATRILAELGYTVHTVAGLEVSGALPENNIWAHR